MSTGTVKQHVNEVIQAESLELGGTAVTATAAELNSAADVSGRTLAITASAAVPAGVQSLLMNHASVTIAATIASAANHQGIFHVKTVTEPGGGADHTLTLTAGTFNGTNNVATFADALDALIVYFDENGAGSILANIGSVALS